MSVRYPDMLKYYETQKKKVESLSPKNHISDKLGEDSTLVSKYNENIDVNNTATISRENHDIKYYSCNSLICTIV